ncbi:hypothetical protein HPB47_027899 [Ixodes persulcatus]|uniref:Uncharacterized protein n=1 Tax=Ixodes persulcatus TaxID=34615 RepID=A0AC60PUS0_IXOPE|nr:hypothetical protein HPB47_027899 [Ixodes persulcatus]
MKYLSCSDSFEECKQVIANVYASTRTRFLEKSVREVLETVSNDTGVCARTVAKYKAQCLSGKVASPKRRPRNVKSCLRLRLIAGRCPRLHSDASCFFCLRDRHLGRLRLPEAP